MIIIPAVDIKEGKCVRLLQGRMEDATVFMQDPAAAAEKWAAAGAERIHVVDLDGAFEKKPRNLPAIRRILAAVAVPIQVGGGIRDVETIGAYLELGVDRAIIGTEAVRNPELVETACRLFPGKIIVGIDARNGLVAIEGWTQTTAVSAVDLARRLETYGLAAINFTDIHRDGMQSGPNIEATRRLAEAISTPVVASGGVATLRDIENLLPLVELGVVGVITGRALYAGTLLLEEAIALVKSRSNPPTTAAPG
jgi:phosphoribosylformimino-5-aminoimidazole carboxamide ribotide isomerase